MGIIRTVRGGIDAEQLGVCLPHEHLLGKPPAPYDIQDPDLTLDDTNASLQELIDLKQTGVDSLIEMTPIDYHRNPQGLNYLAQKSGMHIICVTGFLKDKFCAPFVEDMTVDQLSQLFISEINHGIDDTDIQAGVIKASSSLNMITDYEKKVFQAAAIAQQETGTLISTHTESGTMALQQIKLLTDAGVQPNRILIGHLDRNMDWDHHCAVAEQGVYMGYDQISKSKYYPDEMRVDFIKHMIDKGHLSQLMLSMDLARQSNFASYGGHPGHNYFRNTFIPMLYSAELSSQLIDTMIKSNPKNALTIYLP